MLTHPPKSPSNVTCRIHQTVGQKTSSDTNYTTHNGDTHKNNPTHSPMYIQNKECNLIRIAQLDTLNQNIGEYPKHESTYLSC